MSVFPSFLWGGLIAGPAAGFETRMAILARRRQYENMRLLIVIEYIAS